jgi:hypothetical protein
MISQILGGVMLAYLAAGFLFLAAILWSSPRLKSLALGLLAGALAAHTLAFFARWVASYLQAAAATPPASLGAQLQLILHQAPLSNFYESLVFFSWCLAALTLIFLSRYAEGFLESWGASWPLWFWLTPPWEWTAASGLSCLL